MKMKTKNKPDFKTESLEVTKREGEMPFPEEFIVKIKGDENFSNSDGELIIYQNDKIQVSSIGFEEVYDENDKLVFAYQFRDKEGICIIHIPKDITKENLKRVEEFLKIQKEEIDIYFMSSQEYISPVLNEIGTLINLNKDKKEELKE